jgi:hypothetical protein
MIVIRARSTAVILAAVLLGGALASAAPPPLLPAYAHNDYENGRPLLDALEQGYRGVEADCYLIDGRLLVAHDREDVRPGRTLESLYLEPLRGLVRERGAVLADGTPLLLNIELKESARAPYDTLRAVLARYEDILVTVAGDSVRPGPVQAVLVGWHPPLDEMAAEPVRHAAVQSHFRSLPADHARYPAHLLLLVTVKYKDLFRWNGRGRAPAEVPAGMARVRAAADAVPGRIVRVFNVPRRAACYRALLDGGADLIGTKTLGRSRRVLQKIGAARTAP